MTAPTPRHGPGGPPPNPYPPSKRGGTRGLLIGAGATLAVAVVVAVVLAVIGSVSAPDTIRTTPASTGTIPPPAPTEDPVAALKAECEAALRADIETPADEELDPSCVTLGSDAAGAILASIAVEYGVTDLASPTAAAAGPANTMTEDGTYVVGEDIKPGTYKAPASADCYWARLRDGDGGLDSIIANNISQGRQVVTIRKSDYAFETTRCGVWVRQ